MENKIIEKAMARAIEIAVAHETPYGAVLLDGQGRQRFEAVNTSRADGPTAHAEMNLLREASAQCGLLTDYHLVTTCEPCAMCMGAAIWSRVKSVHFGLSIATASRYVQQIHVDAATVANGSFHTPQLAGGILEEAVETLFEKYA